MNTILSKPTDTLASVTYATLDWNETGMPISSQFNDIYFSNDNGLEETRYVFLTQSNLPQRWHTHNDNHFTIAETGFGTGLNFLATWQWFDQFTQQYPQAKLKTLHFISFEKYPLSHADLIKAHLVWPELKQYATQLQQNYLLHNPNQKNNPYYRIELEQGRVILDLWIGDVKDRLPQAANTQRESVDAWFLDGFAPDKNPQMWSQELFKNMAILAKTNATCTTFTAAGFVRRGLIEAGFIMKKVKGFGKKREMIIGHKKIVE